MARRLPLLRSPPFPDVDPAIAAVSLVGEATPPVTGAEDLFDRIRTARVGGSFWEDQPRIPESDFTLIIAQSAAQASALVEALPGPLVAHLPSAERIDGAFVTYGDIDPWPVLERASRIVAPGDSEWAALAHINRRSLTLQSPGAFDTPEKVAAAILADVYRDPFTSEPADVMLAIERLQEWRRLIDANRPIAIAAGIAWWKRRQIRHLLWAPRPRPLRIARSARTAIEHARETGGAIAVWPSRAPRGLIEGAAKHSIPIVRIEDGFIRSIGLGSNLVPPSSVAVDTRGIYYDPTRPSDLEHLLSTADFGPELRARAERLRDRIIAASISKYGSVEGSLPERSGSGRLILVAGQVEDDESVRLGGGMIAGNAELLRRAREAEPCSEIWYRPHPDVDAGHRKGAVPDREALQYADRIVRGGAMGRLLDRVDGVHVLTSLAGFEGLIRGREVIVHGIPFYAGWGLTRDLGPVPDRRRRRIALPELIAATLILYPRYLDPETGLPCPVEILVSRFETGSNGRESQLTRLRRLQGMVMRKIR